MRNKSTTSRFQGRGFYFWTALICWTAIVVAMTLFFARQALHDYHEEAVSQARAAFLRDLAYRAWCSSHGGVYVPVTEQTQPNPYLIHPERDLVTTTGKELTLVNPAWMTNAVHHLHNMGDDYRLQSHIVSDRPINPVNACDEWEAVGMAKLLDGEEEYAELTEVDGIPYIHLIRPLITSQGCLKCHEQQGYQLGDVRGGISITRPVDDLLARKYQVIRAATAGYGVIWLVGALGIFFGWRKTLRYDAVREKTIKTLRKNEKALRRAKVAAEDANKSKTQFLANMSHEIRTPMSAILGFSDLLYNEQLSPPERDRYIGIVRNNTQLLLGIINDLLDMTKIEAGKVQLESIPVSPVRICDEVVSLMQGRALEKSLRIETKYGDLLPERIMTDPARLRQILINLIGNAVKFTHVGTVTVELGFREKNDAGFLDFSVIDTGIGIDEGQMQRLFQPFMQADASICRSFGGTGLGLVISQKFARLLGGRIDVTSTPGRGSRFTLTLPVVLPKKADIFDSTRDVANNPSAKEPHSPSPVPILTGKRVLLVEDGIDNQRLFSILLRKMDVEIMIAETGQQAVDFAMLSLDAGKPFDLILMDVQMPVMDGCTATKILREKGWEGQIIALTANAMAEDRTRCLEAGVDDHISKPVNLTEFSERVAQALAEGHSRKTPLNV